MSAFKWAQAELLRSKNLLLVGLGLISVFAMAFTSLPVVQSKTPVYADGSSFTYGSVDTMKESRDTDYPVNRQLTAVQIAQDVNLSASLGNNYVTVNTFWDYPGYTKAWVDAVRSAGKHVWFRGHPNQWEGDNGATGLMTPAAYLAAEASFITNNAGLFKSGDIFDPCSEPEDAPYWQATYGNNWSWQPAPPNTGTNDFNDFFVGATNTADAAFKQIGVSGVITTVRSTNSWWAMHSDSLYASSVSRMGMVAVDSYPDQSITDPSSAAIARVAELNAIQSVRHVPVVIGEMGYSNALNVSDATQHAVLSAELNAIQSLSYIKGLNYWVGAGGSGYGGYTNIFSGGRGNWSKRPAADDLAAYFANMLLGASTTQLSGAAGSTSKATKSNAQSGAGNGARTGSASAQTNSISSARPIPQVGETRNFSRATWRRTVGLGMVITSVAMLIVLFCGPEQVMRRVRSLVAKTFR